MRRVLAVDAGSRCLRLMLLERRFGRLRLLRQDAVDLQEEGLVAAEELKAHMQAALAEWGRPPLALALPQQVAVSQIVDLPPVPDAEARQLIAAETVKLGGLGESAMVYDFTRVDTPTENRQSYWVTFCQEIEIQSRIEQLGLDDQDFREITTAGNALLTAWHATRPGKRDAVLVHAGAQSTTLVIIRNGVGVFASSFPMAGDFFTRAIARLRQVAPEAAEALKRSTNLLSGAQALAGFAEIVDGWTAELKRQLGEWGGPVENPAAGLLIATGGLFEQPGLLDYLEARAGLRCQRWPVAHHDDALAPAMGFEIALGTALQALGESAQPASLLPENRRAVWQKRLGRQRLEFANAVLLCACALALGLGIWQKLGLIEQKRALADKIQAGLEVAQDTSTLTGDLLNGYERLRSLFDHQQMTVDALQSLALLQPARSNQSLWFVLVADQQSYFAHPASQAATNKPTVGPTESEFAAPRRDPNASPARPGLIAELCVPEDADAARNTLSLVVSSLKKSPVFARVDQLSEDLRRSLADPKVVLAGRHYALALDFATTEYQAPAGKKFVPPPPGRPIPNLGTNR